eukprot:7802932-Pyramimonas_sp.AAC.1
MSVAALATATQTTMPSALKTPGRSLPAERRAGPGREGPGRGKPTDFGGRSQPWIDSAPGGRRNGPNGPDVYEDAGEPP